MAEEAKEMVVDATPKKAFMTKRSTHEEQN